MKFEKLFFSEEDKIELQKFKDELKDIEIDSSQMSKIYGGCGAVCSQSCSFWCEATCERTCSDSCEPSCRDIVAMGFDCHLCGYLKPFF